MAELSSTTGSRRQWGDKFQTETETVAGAHDSGHTGVARSVEFDFEQVAWIDEYSGVQNHSTFTHFGAAAGNDCCGKAFCGYNSDRYINRQTAPTARVWGDRHVTMMITPRWNCFKLRRSTWDSPAVQHAEKADKSSVTTDHVRRWHPRCRPKL